MYICEELFSTTVSTIIRESILLFFSDNIGTGDGEDPRRALQTAVNKPLSTGRGQMAD